MKETLERIDALKTQLDALRPGEGDLLPPDLQRSQDIELTYSSNAIEGNTLTLDETAALIEHGITVGGKHVNELFEAVDHYEAIQWMRGIAAANTPLTEETITELHRRIVMNSRKDIAGMYSQNTRRIYGSHVVFPNPVKIPALMKDLGYKLSTNDGTPRAAFDMHYQLVTIHPFDDGNGRTARLLMNLMLLRGGYVPVSVRPEDRLEYLNTIKAAQLEQTPTAPAFQAFMHQRLATNLGEYVHDLRQGREARSKGQEANGEKKDEPEPSLSAQTLAQIASMKARQGPGI